MIEKRVMLLGVLLVCCSQLGASIIITPAGYQIGASDGVNGATCDQKPGTCSIGNATATIAMSPLPFLTASAAGNADAIANANYYYMVTNAQGTLDTPVDVDIAYSLFTQEDGGPGNNTQARASVQVTTATDEQASAAVGLFGNPSQTSGVFHLSGLSGRNNSVAVFASAGGNQGSAFASADPYIYIDPNFDNSGGYFITVSEGVGNTQASATPEPASFILVGLALSGAALIRRTRRT